MVQQQELKQLPQDPTEAVTTDSNHIPEELSPATDTSVQPAEKKGVANDRKRQPHKADHRALAGNALAFDDTIEYEIRSDFDSDGETDLALVIQPNQLPEQGTAWKEQDRYLIIGLANPGMKSFRKIRKSTCMAMCRECGGMMGDPFMGLTMVDNNSLALSNYGGSRYRWGISYTIAWSDNDFYVVGFDNEVFDALDPASSKSVSVNLLNGTYRLNKSSLDMPHEKKPPLIGNCTAIESLNSDPW